MQNSNTHLCASLVVQKEREVKKREAMPMLNAKAESYQPVSIRVREAVLNEHAPRFEPVNRSGREVMPSEHSAPLQPVNRDDHSLFLTFSNGFPLTEMQIFDFFNW